MRSFTDPAHTAPGFACTAAATSPQTSPTALPCEVMPGPRPQLAIASLGHSFFEPMPHAVPLFSAAPGGPPVGLAEDPRSLVNGLLQPLIENRATARRRNESTLTPQMGRPVVRLSPIVGKGTYAEVRYGLDSHAQRSAWRIVNTSGSTLTRADDTPWWPTGFGMLSSELTALTLAKSALFPKQSYLDDQGLFYMAIEPYPADAFHLTVGTLALGETQGPERSWAMQKLGRAAMVIALAVAEPLVLLHQANWLHLDVKLENIFYSKERGLVLGDFGLATEQKQQTGALGTLMYAAPELMGLISPHRFSVPATDVFALGATLVQFITGGRYMQTPMFAGGAPQKAQALHELRQAWRHGTWQTAREDTTMPSLVRDLYQAHPWLAKVVVTRMLCLDPAKRWSAARFLSEVRRQQDNDTNWMGQGLGKLTLRAAYRDLLASGQFCEPEPFYERLKQDFFVDRSGAP